MLFVNYYLRDSMYNFFAFRILWKKLKMPLRQVLKDNFPLFEKPFKELLSVTMIDLISILKNELELQIVDNVSKCEVKKDDKIVLDILAIPLKVIKKILLEKDDFLQTIFNNKELSILRHQLDITDYEWDNIVHGYTNAFLTFGIPIAINKMIKNKTVINGTETVGHQIIDLAEGEAIQLDDLAIYCKVIVIYPNTNIKERNVLSTAKRIWESRLNVGYQYNLSNYRTK